ncbi:putative pectinesterase A [Cytospora mali]|uniref:Pectinesterase A n=1 Tax=Cytospora mali TaxID=578113 RepID=A0A194VAS5_CYTMA|nr:putative pectinesterase A [Valsa mali var. pyri (nom. inval.)]
MKFNGPTTALVATVAATALFSPYDGAVILVTSGDYNYATSSAAMRFSVLPFVKNVVRLGYDLSQLSGADDNMDTVALINQDTKLAFTTCQDTLLVEEGIHIYANCYIEHAANLFLRAGDVIWITNSTIDVSDAGCITASGCDGLGRATT